MTTIAVTTETDSQHGWAFTVQVGDNGRCREHRVALSWRDYDHWSHGRVAPERVVEAAMRYMLDRGPADDIDERFDCAVIRRYYPQVDRELPSML